MASLIAGYEYDIFISYRHKDNRYDGWVSEFVANLRRELEGTIKEDVSIYFDENPHDGVLETHNVDRSLAGKLKAVIFVPIISQTYCDPKSFAWQHEFVAFNNISRTDPIGREVRVSNGNVASRILPVKIHEIDAADRDMIQNELGDILRPVDFIYKSSGVNRPLRPNEEHPDENIHRTIYRNQINKVANAVKEMISALLHPPGESALSATHSVGAYTKKEKDTIVKVRKDKSVFFPGFYANGINRGRVASTLLYSFAPAILLSLATGVFIWNFKPTPAKTDSGAIRTTILLPQDSPVEFIGSASLGVGRKSLAISKDGRKVAYVTRSGGTTKLMIRSIDNFRVDEIPGTEGAYNPVFSPDGKYLAFFQKNYVKKLMLQNYAVSTLAERPELWDATWSAENELFFSSHEGRNLYRYFQTLELMDTINLLGFKSIQRIPQTDYLLASYGQINLLNVKTLQKTKLDIRGTNARFIPPGYIIFLTRSSLMAVRFDIQKLEITSDAVEVLTGIRSESGGDGQFDFSSDGKLVFVEGADARMAHFVFYDPKRSRIEPLNFSGESFAQLDLSPDGTRVAVSDYRLARDIYIYELKTGIVKRLTNQGACSAAVWHPDGQRLYFVCKTDGYFKYVDNEEPAKLLLRGARVSSFFQNGKMAVVQKGLEVFVSSTEDISLSKVCNGAFSSISPAGNYISYTSSESGELHVYLQDLDSGKKWRVSTEAGSEESRWSSDGKRLIYRAGQKWMEVSVRYRPSFALGSPMEIFTGEFTNVPGYSWDISSDGQKFLLLQNSAEKSSFQISMIQGWFDELNRLVPPSTKNNP